MKLAVSIIITVKATRLLQAIQPVTCASVDCQPGNNCYDTSNGAVCCDPNICLAGRCGGNGLYECEQGYECVVSFCPYGLTDCPGVCINPSAQPTAGELCGKQGVDCAALRAPAGICSNGKCYGNCGDCIYKHDANGNFNCEPQLIAKEAVCPCGGFEHCASYTPDGCNTCLCRHDGTPPLCTYGACDSDGYSECRICSDGYSLNAVTKECEAAPTLTCANVRCAAHTMCDDTSTGPVCVDIEPEPKAKVGCGIDHCNSIFNGCNYCSCDGFKEGACTKRACITAYSEAYCTWCEAGYMLNPSTNKCEASGERVCSIICPSLFPGPPVCCDGRTYLDSCVARCAPATSVCSRGECQ